MIRSSVSFGEEETVCGASMIVSPRGQVLCNMRGRFGMAQAVFDPADKHLKPAGFGAADAPHHRYIEYGRKPWQYRPAGSFIIPDDRWLPKDRVRRDLRGVTGREALLTAIGAAVALDVQEIALDLPETALLENILRKFACHVIFDLHVPQQAAPEQIAQIAALACHHQPRK